jgi:hypothetical protein
MKRHPTLVYGGVEVQDHAIFPRNYIEENDQLRPPSVLNPEKVFVVSEERYKLYSYKVYHFNTSHVRRNYFYFRADDIVHAAVRSIFHIFNKALSYVYVIKFRT